MNNSIVKEAKLLELISCAFTKAKPYAKSIRQKARKELLEFLEDKVLLEVGNYVLVKGNPKGKPFLQIYTKESYKRAQDYLESSGKKSS